MFTNFTFEIKTFVIACNVTDEKYIHCFTLIKQIAHLNIILINVLTSNIMDIVLTNALTTATLIEENERGKLINSLHCRLG